MAVPPGITEVNVGAMANEKSGAVTVSVTVAECDSPSAPVPVIVNVKLPAAVPEAVVTVSVDVPEALTELGEKEAVAATGNPVALSVTVPVNPLRAATFTV